jgi:hypothetical protein
MGASRGGVELGMARSEVVGGAVRVMDGEGRAYACGAFGT